MHFQLSFLAKTSETNTIMPTIGQYHIQKAFVLTVISPVTTPVYHSSEISSQSEQPCRQKMTTVHRPVRVEATRQMEEF